MVGFWTVTSLLYVLIMLMGQNNHPHNAKDKLSNVRETLRIVDIVLTEDS